MVRVYIFNLIFGLFFLLFFPRFLFLSTSECVCARACFFCKVLVER
jgi:hypothetical protein